MNVQIVGTMLDPSGGEPAGGAMIQFIALAQYGGVPKGAQSTQTTSATGEYDFPLNYGRYSLSINHSGRFVNQAVSVTVNEDSPPIMDIDLLLKSSVPLTPPEFKYLEELLAKAELAAGDAEGFASDAAYQVSLAEGEVIKATNQANIASNEADRAKSEADRAKEVTGLDTVEQAVDMALGEFAGIMSESEARAINATNDNHFDASGFVHMGKHGNDGVNVKAVNEGVTINIGSANYANKIYMGKPDWTGSVTGTSKTDFAVAHIAGAISTFLTGTNTYLGQAFELPQAEDGTRIYDSTGDARGSGKASLDLKVDADPKYGNKPTGTEAQILREAVGRAFEGQCKNGDFRLGKSLWVETLTTTYSVTNGVASVATGSDSNGRIEQYVGSLIGVDCEFVVTAKNPASNTSSARISVGGAGGTIDIDPSDSVQTITYRTSAGDGYFRIYPSTVANGQSIEIYSTVIRRVTEEVVTHPVDLVGLEYYEEELTDPSRIEIMENIGSFSTTFGTTSVPTVLSTRKLSYFQQYDGQFPEVTADPDFINDRYRCVVWNDLTEPQKREIAAYMGERLFMGVNGFPVNGRLRPRTIRGLGNGDWKAINVASGSASDGSYIRFSDPVKVRARGNSDDATDYVIGSTIEYVNDSSQYNNTAGIGKGVWRTRSEITKAYQNRCFLYVVATVPRANKGGYHPDLNSYGTTKFFETKPDGTTWGSRNWYEGQLTLLPQTEQDCFRFASGQDVPMNGRPMVNSSMGKVGTASAHPDGIFYDGIEAGGLNGVIDWRLGAVANDSPEEAAKVEAKVENGTYRGLEKLVWMQKVQVWDANPSNPSVAGFSTDGEPSGSVSITTNDVVTAMKSAGATSYDRAVNARSVGIATIDSGLMVFLSGSDDRLMVLKSSTTIGSIAYMPVNPNLSVSGEFNAQMVIGDPANILLTDALKDGWLGAWCPVIPPNDSTVVDYEFTRKNINTGSQTSLRFNVNTDYWDSFTNTIDNTKNKIGTANFNGGSYVGVLSYKAFAKQNKPSTNKPVYNAKEGLLGVTVTQSYDKSVLAEAVAGVILKSDAGGIVTEQSSPVKFLVNEVIERITSLATDMVAPTNSSQAIKIAIYQISENGQVSLGFIANTMTHNGTDWGELDEIIIPFGDLEVDTFNDANGILQTTQSTMSAMPHGWTSNHARAGVQVPGVDL